MKKGESVRVRVYPDKVVQRIVWEERETYVVLCRPEIYKSAIQKSQEPEVTMGFPKEDIIQPPV